MSRIPEDTTRRSTEDIYAIVDKAHAHRHPQAQTLIPTHLAQSCTIEVAYKPWIVNLLNPVAITCYLCLPRGYFIRAITPLVSECARKKKTSTKCLYLKQVLIQKKRVKSFFPLYFAKTKNTITKGLAVKGSCFSLDFPFSTLDC